MTTLQPRQATRRILNPKEAAEALFAKRVATPANTNAPRILEDVSKAAPVELRKRRPLRTEHCAGAVTSAANDIDVGNAGVSRIGSIETSVVSICPETARWMRDNFNFERQRKISQVNVNRLAGEMRDGRFTPGTQIYLCATPDGKQVIVNGNHTLEAVHASGVSQTLVITRNHVENIDEAGKFYAVFDIHKARTWLDSLKATGIGEDSATRSSKVLAALGVIENRFEQSGPSVNGFSRIGRIERIVEYNDASDLFFAAIDGATKEGGMFVKRAPIMAVALTTFRYQPTLASEFWRTFALDSGLVEGMPERALMSYLRNNKGSTGSATRKLTARAAALAWNAKFRDDEVKMIKPGGMASFFLLGTNLSRGFKVEA